MAEMSRPAKWTFATWLIAAALFGFGRLLYQDPQDKPEPIMFAVAFTNSGAQSLWERLQNRQYLCVENAIYRSLPRRGDGDLVDFNEACYGERILRLHAQGGQLSVLQEEVRKAQIQYNEQQRYYLLAAFFFLLGLVPQVYIRSMRFWNRRGKPIVRFFRSCYDVIRKMSS